jgi:hypothetical protein
LAGLAYPAAAFTPSGGSPPIPSASSAYFHFDSSSVVGAGRRHTVSAYASSPMPIELNLVGHPEIDETLIKEEKRRRVSPFPPLFVLSLSYRLLEIDFYYF